MPLVILFVKKEGKGETDMKQETIETEKPSFWQMVFLQSKVNGATYNGEELHGRNWEWPKILTCNGVWDGTNGFKRAII